MLVAIGLVYMNMVILFGSVLVSVVILFALPLAVIVVTNANVLLDLAVVTNTTVLREIAQHTIEAGADVRTVLTQGGRTHVRPMLMRRRVGTWPAGSYRWPGHR